MSQSKSEDNWLQEVLDNSTPGTYKLTQEEAREIKILKRKGFKDFAATYYEYLQLEKREGSLDCSLEEFCEIKGVKYRFPK